MVHPVYIFYSSITWYFIGQVPVLEQIAILSVKLQTMFARINSFDNS